MLTFLESLPAEEDDTENNLFFLATAAADSEGLFLISEEDGFPEFLSLFVLPSPPPPPRSRFMLSTLPSLEEETDPLLLVLMVLRKLLLPALIHITRFVITILIYSDPTEFGPDMM